MKFEVHLKNLSSLTIGNSSRIAYVDIGFNDMGIPGSSIKGAMRTAISWAIKNGLVREFTSCGEVRPEKIIEAHKKGVCDVCKLFGYPDHEGILRVSSISINKINVLTRVSIKDDTNTSKEHALFKQEVIPPNQDFTFEVELYTQDCRMLELTLLSLYFLRLWRLGRGGMIDLKIDEIKECPSLEIKKYLGDWLWQ
ncbi:RAMP superfamily CRISPR-associated protein [Acidianus brierleyi]|uniref:CRISPR type III-associated protein domain-containing protein n=1 Tax=Acidianus brierleyi TaxID=41673 RepID=A0A2U9IHF4_9CREN|nr:RAMP superfamily CRISPR-associated protein [Acidianus brierleyi]AWR95459.1 hypothetical protein DFR85_13520 [Acidianus brierleyi]